MSVTLTEQDLVNIKLTVLTLERQEIARNIDPRRFFGHLRAKYIFDERDCDEIRALPSRIGSAEAFVDILKRKGAQGYDEFCSALMKDKTQLFLLQRMTKTLEQLRAKVLDKKRENLLLKSSAQAAGGHFPLYSYHTLPHPGAPPPPRYFANHPTIDSAPLRHIAYHGPPVPPHPMMQNGHRPLRKVNSRTTNNQQEYLQDSNHYYYQGDNGSVSPTMPELNYVAPPLSSSLPEHNQLMPDEGDHINAYTPPPLISSYPPPQLMPVMGEAWSDGPFAPMRYLPGPHPSHIGFPGPHPMGVDVITPPPSQGQRLVCRGGGQEEDEVPVGFDEHVTS